MKSKLTLLTSLTLLTLLGAGCLPKLDQQSTIGASRFGRLIDEPNSESVIKDGWVRVHPGPFWWDKIEKEKGASYEWEEADDVVRYWQSRDQAILATIWPFAQWDQNSCHTDDPKVKDPFGTEMIRMNSICHVEPFQNWVRTMSERYDGDGIDDMPGLKYPITHWEISNEPDMQTPELTFFQSGNGAYEEIFRLAHDEIKTANQDAKVLFAGMSQISMGSLAFWRGILSQEHVRGDIGNIHSIKSSDQFFAKEYRDFWKGLGRDKQPFWITEALVGSLDDDWDEEKKEEMMFIGFVDAFANGAEKIFYVGTPNKTLELLVDTIDKFEKAERVSEDVVKFVFPKREIYALWNDATLPENIKGKVEVISYDGVRQKINVREVNTDKPTFIIP